MNGLYENEMKLEFISKSNNEAFARITVAAFAAQLDPTIEELADIKTAVSEAVTNCIIHGYENKDGIIKVVAKIFANTLEVEISDTGKITGTIDILDIRFGNLWTNIPKEIFDKMSIAYGDTLELTIKHDTRNVYSSMVKFVKSFAEVHIGGTLLYMNSLNKIGIAINQGSFSRAHKVESGYQWKVELKKI